MGIVRQMYDAWSTAKSLALCPLLTFVAGWLTSEMTKGTLDPANTTAAWILLIVSCVFLFVLLTLGTYRWVSGRLTLGAQAVACASAVALLTFFWLGWHAKIP